MSRRDRYIGQVESALGRRDLVWFGTRGEDARSLLAVEQFSASFAVTGRLQASSIAPTSNVALEEITRLRVDLDTYELDDDVGDHMDELRSGLLAALQRPSVVLPYRASAVLAALHFVTMDTSTVAGPFKEIQAAFEHKPWVETSVRALGVPTIPWRYVPDDQRARVVERTSEGPVVLRPSRSAGGVGIALSRTDTDVGDSWSAQPDLFISVAPFYTDAVSFNLAGCVHRDGTVNPHPASVQLVGLPELTSRPFGYCGNDFAAMADVPRTMLDDLEAMITTVGRWLHGYGWIGAFGIDAIWTGTDLLFVELNPRFQGSTWVGGMIAQATGGPELVLEHLGAWLDVPPPAPTSLRGWVDGGTPLTNVVVHGDRDWSDLRAHLQPATVARELDVPDGVKAEATACTGRVAIRGRYSDLGLGSTGLNAISFGGDDAH